MNALHEAIILAGGLGTRLRPVVADRPKGLALIAGKPFLSRQIESLAQRGIRRVILALGYKAEMVQGVLGSEHAGVSLRYSLEEEPLGTGGALKKAAALCTDSCVLALNGDTFLDISPTDMVAALTPPAIAAIALATVPNVERYGTVDADPSGIVRAFLEKGRSGPGQINGGVYALDLSRLQPYWPATDAFSMERVLLPTLAALKVLRAVPTQGLFLDIGTPEDFERAQDIFARHP